MRLPAYVAIALGITHWAMAQPALIRFGNHAGFGRVVFEFAGPVDYTSERLSDRLSLHFVGAGDIPGSTVSVRNVISVAGGTDQSTLTLATGSSVRVQRLGQRVVVDVFDARDARRKSSLVKPKQLQAPPVLDPRMRGAATPVIPSATAPAATATAASPLPQPTSADGTAPKTLHTEAADHEHDPPTAMKPTMIETPPGKLPEGAKDAATLAIVVSRHMTSGNAPSSEALIVPFGPNVGAAAFRHGEHAWVVFDERRPLDLTRLPQGVAFFDTETSLLPNATLIKMRVRSGGAVRLAHGGEGWTVTLDDGVEPASTVMPKNVQSRLMVPVAHSGEVVVVPDTDTGHNLLVGTLLSVGPGIPVNLTYPEFAIRPSWQGVVVEPTSDRTALRSVKDGFTVGANLELPAMQESAGSSATGSVYTRRFDFPIEPVAALLRRLQAQTQAIAAAPTQARLQPRKAAAQTMLALGLAAEAQSLLVVAAAENPEAMADPDLNGLTGVAALLNGRPSEATGLDADGLNGSDEIALWRAARAAMLKEGSPEIAPVFAAVAGLAVTYPRVLRDFLLALAGETMALGGEPNGADAMLARLPNEPALELAHAIRLEQTGKPEAALTILDALERGHDRLTGARAATRATLLRLATGEIDAAEAAVRLERGYEGWRGDARERDLRIKTAEIQAVSGQWRKAFQTLQETSQLFPSDQAMIAGHVTTLMRQILHEAGGKSLPLDFIALTAEYADAVAAEDQPAMTLLIADKLLELDLPKRAKPLLERLLTSTSAGTTRAEIGRRLAALQLDVSDVVGAAATLSTTETADMPPELYRQRGLLEAQIDAQNHDPRAALAALARVGGQQAEELSATILADSGDLHGASQALRSVIARVIPDTGDLTEAQQELLVRAASFASRAHDDDTLRELALKDRGRMTKPRSGMFRLLTAMPGKSAADIGRIAENIALLQTRAAASPPVATP